MAKEWWEEDKVADQDQWWASDPVAETKIPESSPVVQEQPDQEVITSARPWNGAGAGRGSFMDPRRTDIERPEPAKTSVLERVPAPLFGNGNDVMLQPSFVEGFRRTLADLPLENRLAALKAYADTDKSVYGRAARAILQTEEYRNAKITPEDVSFARDFVRPGDSAPKSGGTGLKPREAFPDAIPKFWEDRTPAEVALENANALGVSEAHREATKSPDYGKAPRIQPIKESDQEWADKFFGGGGPNVGGFVLETAGDAWRGIMAGKESFASGAWDLLGAAATSVGGLGNFANIARAAGDYGRERQDNWRNPNHPDSATFAAFQSMTQMAISAGLTGNLGAASTAIQSAISGANAYGEALQSGKNNDEAIARGVNNFAAEWIGEMVSLPFLKGFLKTAAESSSTVKQFASALAKEQASEQVGEQLTTAIESFYDKFGVGGIKPNMTWADYINDAQQTAKTVLVQSMYMAGGATAGRAVKKAWENRSPEAAIAAEIGRNAEDAQPVGGIGDVYAKAALDPNSYDSAIVSPTDTVRKDWQVGPSTTEQRTVQGLADIAAATTVDDAIGAAARATSNPVPEMNIPETEIPGSAPGADIGADAIARSFGVTTPETNPATNPDGSLSTRSIIDAIKQTETPNVGMPTDVPGVDSAATGRGGDLTSASVATGAGDVQRGTSVPGLDNAGRPADQDVLPGTGQSEALTEPKTVWFGRRGDGYQTAKDASVAIPARRKEFPELSWSVEQMPNGRFRLAGYETKTPEAAPADAGVSTSGIKASNKTTTEPFYSALSREISSIPAKAQGADGWRMQIKGLINKGKVKADEVEWSGLEDYLKLQQGKVTKEQVQQFLDNNGVKVEEVRLGENQKPLSLEEWIKKNHPQQYDKLMEYRASGDAEGFLSLKQILERNWRAGMGEQTTNPTKYQRYTLPGGENYREVLLTLPEKKVDAPRYATYTEMPTSDLLALLEWNDSNGEYRGLTRDQLLGAISNEDAEDEPGTMLRHWNERGGSTSVPMGNYGSYRSSHWNQPNVLAHVRLNDRTDANGKRVLFVEELQSDWGQAGRDKGFDTKEKQAERERLLAEQDALHAESIELQRDGYGAMTVEQNKRLAEINQRLQQIAAELPTRTGVPEGPFVAATDKWLNIALKRIVKMAVDEGYDKVAFVNGDQSAERYDLSKQVAAVKAEKNMDGSFSLRIKRNPGDRTFELLKSRVGEDELSDAVGKDLAEKIAKDGGGTYSGLDLKVGGEGMKAFYDQIVPLAASKLVAKLGGGKMETVSISSGEHASDNEFGADDTRIEEIQRGGEVLYETTDGLLHETYADAVEHEQGIAEKYVSLKQQPGFTITPEMREKVAGGLPLFTNKQVAQDQNVSYGSGLNQGAVNGQSGAASAGVGQGVQGVSGVQPGTQQGAANQSQARTPVESQPAGGTPQAEGAGTAGPNLKLALHAPESVQKLAWAALKKDGRGDVQRYKGNLTGSEAVASIFAKMLGKTLTFYEQTNPGKTPPPNGFVMDNDDTHIFAEKNSTDAPLMVIVHEALHLIPEARKEPLKVGLRKVFRDDKYAEFARDYGYDVNNKKQVDEEIAAMIAQAVAHTQEFWSDLRDAMGNADFSALAKLIIQHFNRILSRASNEFGQEFLDKYVTDVKQARDLLVQEYARAMKEQGLQPDKVVVGGGFKASPKAAVSMSDKEAIGDSEDNEPRVQQKEIPAAVDLATSLQSAQAFAQGATWRTGRDLKMGLQKRALRAAQSVGVNLRTNSDSMDKYLVRVGVKDALYALGQNPNAVGWYDTKTTQALSIAALMHPELSYDENARFAYTWALAVTSNGMKVDKNFELADKVYRKYKSTGKMPTNIRAGQAQAAINKSLKQFNDLVARWDIDNLRKFAQTNFTVGEIGKLGDKMKPGGEHVDVVVKGAAILGPKIGNGFFSNLYGHFDALTMDRWLIRTWGRWSATLLMNDKENTRLARDRLEDAIIRISLNSEERKHISSILGRSISFDSNPDEMARAIQKASMKPELRSAMNETEAGEELRKSGNSLAKYLDQQKEAPKGPNERKKIRRIFRQILSELNKTDQYKNLNMADLQAALWYGEKRLYEVAKEDEIVTGEDDDVDGYADDEAPDYANAAAKIAREKRIPEDKIRTILSNPNPDKLPGSGGFSEAEAKTWLKGEVDKITLEREQKSPKMSRVVFEVAPDPNDELLVERWRSLSAEDRSRISERVMRKIVPKILEQYGNQDSIFLDQTGSYLDDTNPSFAVLLKKSGDSVAIAKAIGYALSQDSMLVISPKAFKGGEETGAVVVNIGNKTAAEVDAIYQTLHAIEADGEKVINGQSTINGQMVILNYSKVPTKALAKLVDSALGRAYHVQTTSVFTAFPEKKDYDYASQRNDTQRAGQALRQWLDPVRAEASAALREAVGLDAAEAPPGSSGQAATEVNQTPADAGVSASGIVASNKTKVVDEQGKPKTVYHGTQSSFAQFDPGKIGSGQNFSAQVPGFWFAEDSGIAKRFGQNVVAAKLDITNPFVMPAAEYMQKFMYDEEDPVAFRADLEKHGYDGLKIEADPEYEGGAGPAGTEEWGQTNWVAFKPEQIKASNKNIQPLRGTEEEAVSRGYTMTAYRGVDLDNPFNDSGTAWLTTNRDVAQAYAEEVMGYENPGVIKVKVNPEGLPRYDASRMTDEQRSALGADVYGNPQSVGIYDRSDDHPLGGSVKNVTVIHAPQSAVFVVDEKSGIKASNKQTETPEFKRWFDGSQVVDESGRPLVMYHGTTGDFSQFDISQFGQTDQGESGVGFYFTPDPANASYYAAEEFPDAGGSVMPVFLSIKNPYQNTWRGFGETLDSEALKARGHDGVITRDEKGKLLEIVAFKPEQIKSIFNPKPTNAPGILASNKKDDVTSTPQFRDWFGGSKVVDADGKPLVVYHGTASSFDAFGGISNISEEMGGTQRAYFFTSNPDRAEDFAVMAADGYDAATGERTSGENIVPVYLALKNPLVVDRLVEEVGEIFDLVAQAQEQGHDGLIMPRTYDYSMYHSGEYDEEVPVYIAFRPEQIKSAIGNSGAFDPANPDIRYSNPSQRQAAQQQAAALGQPANVSTAQMQANAAAYRASQANTWTMPDDKVIGPKFASVNVDAFLQEWQDGRLDLKVATKAIRAAGLTIREEFDARRAETLFPGRVAYRTQSFLEQEARPLLQAMILNKVDQTELGDYLLARHAPERNAYIATINPNLPDGGAGRNSQGVLMTTQAANDYIANLDPRKKTALDIIAARVDAITQGTRQLLVSEGLEKQSTIDAWENVYPNYAPLFKDDAQSGAPHPQGTGMSVRGSASKRALGSTAEVTNVLAHVLMQREAAITRAEKNRVGLSLYGMVLTNPNKDFWTVIQPSMSYRAIANELTAMGIDPVLAVPDMSVAPTIRRLNPNTNQVEEVTNPLYKNMPNALIVRIDGEDRVIMFNENDDRAMRLANNLKGQDGLFKEYDIGNSVMAKVTRWMASVNTQYNPVFGMVNMVRDLQGAAFNLDSTPLRGNSAKVLSNVPAAIIGIARDVRGDASRTNWSDLWLQFQEDGGRTGYKDLFREAGERAKAIEDELGKLEKDGRLTAGKAAGAVLDLLGDFNDAIENGVRLSAYKVALENGIANGMTRAAARAEAAKIARELTVDFNRRGARNGPISGFMPVYAFMNASIQGTARTVQTLKGPTGKAIIAGGLALGTLQALMLAAAGFDDDDIPDWIKARSLIIPMSWRAKPGEEKRYISIPYALGLHVLPNTGRVITELTIGDRKNMGKRIGEAIGEIAGAFSPFGGGNIFTLDGALKTVAPTPIDPVIEMMSNKNFTGRPIEKKPFNEEQDNLPGFTRARERTQRTLSGQAYLGISKALNTATGGSKYEKGVVSPTPEMLRYMAETVGGGVLREVEKIVDTSWAMVRGDEVKNSGIPVSGRFVGEVDDAFVQSARFYENKQAILKAQSSRAAAKKAKDMEGRQEVQAAHPELDSYRALENVDRRLARLSKQVLENVDKPDVLINIDRQRTEIMREFNRRVRELENRPPTMADSLRKWGE